MRVRLYNGYGLGDIRRGDITRARGIKMVCRECGKTLVSGACPDGHSQTTSNPLPPPPPVKQDPPAPTPKKKRGCLGLALVLVALGLAVLVLVCGGICYGAYKFFAAPPAEQQVPPAAPPAAPETAQVYTWDGSTWNPPFAVGVHLSAPADEKVKMWADGASASDVKVCLMKGQTVDLTTCK